MTIPKLFFSAVVALAVGAAVAALGGSGKVLSLLTQAVIYAVFAIGVGLLLRQNGMVSFGHALFFGTSGYAIGIILQMQLMPAEVAELKPLRVRVVTARPGGTADPPPLPTAEIHKG